MARIMDRAMPILQRFLRSGPGGVAVLLAIECAVFTAWTSATSARGATGFLSAASLTNLLEATTIYAFLALAQTPVMIAGGIDLSVGSTLALSQCVCAALVTTDPRWVERGFLGVAAPQLPGWCGLAGGVAAGALFGCCNGVLVAMIKLPPFLLTLGTLSVGRGLAILLSRSNAIARLPGWELAGDARAAPAGTALFDRFGKPNTLAVSFGEFDLYFPTLILIAAAIAVAVFLARTVRGRSAYAVGGNSEAARLAGIPIASTQCLLYTLCGALAGAAGAFSAFQYGTFDPQAGVGYELGAVAACVLGGVSLTGGTGGVPGPLLGALLFAALRKGLNQTGVGGEWNELALGLVIVVALAVDRVRRSL